jgi:septal ring factor EnvC (AmiA/AmiB activator)
VEAKEEEILVLEAKIEALEAQITEVHTDAEEKQDELADMEVRKADMEVRLCLCGRGFFAFREKFLSHTSPRVRQKFISHASQRGTQYRSRHTLIASHITMRAFLLAHFQSAPRR